MSNRTLVILAVVAVCMVTAAIVTSRISGRTTVTVDKPAYLIQGLDPDDIGSIVVGSDDDAVTLKRYERVFVVGMEKDKMHEKELSLKIHERLQNSTYIDLETNKKTHSGEMVEVIREHLSEIKNKK